MIAVRDSRGHFSKGNVPWNKRLENNTREGVLKLERVKVICPLCGQQVEVVARDGRVKGYCAVARQSVDFLIETQLERKRRGRVACENQ